MSSRLVVSLAVAAIVGGCSSATVSTPDSRTTVPRSAAGNFAVISQLDLEAVPGGAGTVVDAIVAATDGPDDPSRFVLDYMIAALPDGTVKTIATAAVPLVAAYLNTKLPPTLVTGFHQLADGLARISRQLATLESLWIDPSGTAQRTITAIRFAGTGAPVDVTLADHELGVLGAATRVTLDGEGNVAFAEHAIELPYGHILRLGLDLAVAPATAPNATSLADALATLVDCEMVGQVVSSTLAVGSPGLYEDACRAGMVAAAAELDGKLDAIDATPFMIVTSGRATGLDTDGDGAMDQINNGEWLGTATYADAPAPLASATFDGSRVN